MIDGVVVEKSIDLIFDLFKKPSLLFNRASVLHYLKTYIEKKYVSNHEQQLDRKFSQQSLTVYSLKKTIPVNFNFIYIILFTK